MNRSVKAFAPASVSNVACGFDVFGFAVNDIGDQVTLSHNNRNDLKIVSIEGDDGRLPLDPQKNTATIALSRFLSKAGLNEGLDVSIKKNLPLCSGLGSSAASAAAAVKAANELFNNPLNELDLLECVVEAESFISGSRHADNAAPALFGGFQLVRSTDPLDVNLVPVPDQLHYVILHQNVEISTNHARSILPQMIPLKSAVQHWANTAALVHGLHSSDYKLIAHSLQDLIAEPLRYRQIPHYEMIKQAVEKEGALGFNISGSGPAVFVLCASEKDKSKIVELLQKMCSNFICDIRIYSGKIRQKGAEIVI